MSFFTNLRHPRDFTSHTFRRGTLYNKVQSNIVFFSTGGPFSRWPRAADLGAARLARREIDRGPAGRESRPRRRPEARVARSQVEKIESVSRVTPPPQRGRAGDVKPALRDSHPRKEKSSVDPIH